MRYLWILTGAWVLAAGSWSAPLRAAATAEGQGFATAEQAEAGIPSAPVTLDGRVLFHVRGSTSLPADTRAAGIAARIAAAARDRQVALEDITIVATEVGEEIRAGQARLMIVAPSDGVFESMPHQALAQFHLRGIREAIANYRQDRQPKALLRGLLVSLAATALFLLVFRLLGFGYRRLEAQLEQRYRHRVESLPLQPATGTDVSLWRTIHASASASHWALRLAMAFAALQVILTQFPWTRWLGDGLGMLLFSPLVSIGTGFVEYLPKLFFLIVLAVVTRGGLRLLRLYFGAVERGASSLRNFDAEWAMPTYKIVRTVVIALALIMAYPYLPGSGTEALQGISVFAGLLFSLGASSAVSGVIAGYLNTFGRIFKVGDLIEVGSVRGVVTQVRLLTTRVRTIRNEEVTIPNATITSTSVVNFSAMARERGLVLQTEVGIGYEVPWRQVNAMLLEAAARTPDLLKEPAPFVIQRQLGDFAVVYQLNAHTSNPTGMMRTYSALHQNVLDVFNENGVQIMTPAYEGDPESPKVVPKEQWFTPPARPTDTK